LAKGTKTEKKEEWRDLYLYQKVFIEINKMPEQQINQKKSFPEV